MGKRLLNVMSIRILVAGLLCLCPALGALADALSEVSEPLYVKNLSPVAALFGLPSQRSASTAEPGELGVSLHASVASHFVSDSNRRELINLDGETRRLALELRYGISENWDIQLELPWLDHSGGDLDKLIDDWHDLWGMADGGRSDAPRDVLAYRYARAEGDLALAEDSSGTGDVSISVSHAFYRTESAAASAVLGYKFGTGEIDDFTGSGADDMYLALRMSGDHLSGLPFTWHGQAGYLRAGKADVIGRFQQRDMWFAGISMDWRFAERWSAIVQLDSHAAPLSSELTAVGDEAFLLSVGARWRFARRWLVDLSVVEDIGVETAPDVAFQASIRWL